MRDSPCSERFSRSSSGRVTTIAPSSLRATVIGSATVKLKVPLGPFTETFWPSIVTSTPVGTGTGCLPMRDMFFTLLSRYHTYARTSPPTPCLAA